MENPFVIAGKIIHDIFAELDPGATCDTSHTEKALQRLISESQQKYGEMITSGAFIRKHHLKSASSVQAASKKLLEYHFLSTEAGAYYIDDQLLRLWLLV